MDPFAPRRIGRTSLAVTPLGCGGATLGDSREVIAEAQSDAGLAEEYWRRLIGPRRDEARAICTHAGEHGLATAGAKLDLALDLLYGPIYHRLFHGHAPLDEPFLRAVVDSAVSVLERG